MYFITTFFLLFKQFSVFSSLSPVISPSPNYSQNRGCFCLHISIFYPPSPVLFFKSFKAHNPSPIYILRRRRLSPLFLIYKKYPQSPPRMLFPPPLFLSVYSRLPFCPNRLQVATLSPRLNFGAGSAPDFGSEETSKVAGIPSRIF